jgi:4'-phosphopantetheinyl transferase
LTHSDGLAVLAVASDRAVGVDIERMRTVAEDMTDWIMTDEEKRCFRSLPPELRRDVFFQCWTRKEAVLKAIGRGFSLSPRCLEVSFGVNGHSRLLCIGGDRMPTQRWRVADFAPAPGYAGAIAAPEPPWTLRLRQSR